MGEYRGEFFDSLSITGAVRHDDNDKFRDFTTWRASASLLLKSVGLRPHASIGTGVALPGMFEQFGSVLGDFVGNPNLQPEESRGWDAGIEFTSDTEPRFPGPHLLPHQPDERDRVEHRQFADQSGR